MRPRQLLGSACLILALVTTLPALAQNSATAECAADPKLPAFEVASIRPVAPNDMKGTIIGEYGLPTFELKRATLSLLVSFSFDVRPDNFINAPSGLADKVFDVRVESVGGLLLNYETLKPRMQQMLEERFCLKARTGTKEVSGYGLFVAKDGFKLTPLKESKERATAYMTENEFGATNATLAMIAGVLTSAAERPVKDETGLPGTYNVKLQFAPADDPSSTLPSIFTAIKEQLGLELKPAKVPVSTLTIDHINLAPTEN
jgi:uncharacterized protein (TIGR03435 family)